MVVGVVDGELLLCTVSQGLGFWLGTNRALTESNYDFSFIFNLFSLRFVLSQREGHLISLTINLDFDFRYDFF